MTMSVEQSVEWLVGETEVLAENLPDCRFVRHKSHITWPGLFWARCLYSQVGQWITGFVDFVFVPREVNGAQHTVAWGTRSVRDPSIVFRNPILFAVYTGTFSKLCKKVYSGMQKSAQERSSVTNGSKASCRFWEWDLQHKPYKYDNYTGNVVGRSFGSVFAIACCCLVAPWGSVLGRLGVLWGEL
jgi:hypothetical protein